MASCWNDCIHCKACGGWKNAKTLTQQAEEAETIECFENKADFVKITQYEKELKIRLEEMNNE